mmetsp:Transcript_33904/g.81285  ORF Transcript_33904/g.81285 Transcript_33904/m.81285 type:complete len:240 (+) Transcript_33904:822-1541(+)
MEHRRVANHIGLQANLQHSFQPIFCTLGIADLDGCIDQCIESNDIWAGFAPGQDEVKHAFCLLLLTSMSKGVDGGTQCNHVRLNTMLAHERHDLLGCHRVLFFRVCGDHRIEVPKHALLREEAEPSLGHLRLHRAVGIDRLHGITVFEPPGVAQQEELCLGKLHVAGPNRSDHLGNLGIIACWLADWLRWLGRTATCRDLLLACPRSLVALGRARCYCKSEGRRSTESYLPAAGGGFLL